ncbi:MAG: rubrerythrin family protein [Clostridium sp.]|nr:rubrerythrin family protein [Clostridium sp.]
MNIYRESNNINENNVDNSTNNNSLKGSETEKNLYKTFAGECRAVVKYMLYAEKAKEEGYMWLGEVFDDTSLNELAHARVVLKTFLGLIGSTLDNLKDVFAGETNEYENLYKEFEETAQREGFMKIAKFYKELREVEENHSKNFKELSDKLDDGTIFEGPMESKWYCMNCGYIYEGPEAPAVCPLCGYPRAYFKRYCEITNL